MTDPTNITDRSGIAAAMVRRKWQVAMSALWKSYERRQQERNQ
jgi:hypothetical protein